MGAADLSGDAFERVLDEARRAFESPLEPEGARRVTTSLPPGFDVGPARGGGGEARWGLAMDWAAELAGPVAPRLDAARPPEPEPTTADVAAAVARELGFKADMTRKALTERWRAFVWRNHPDRQPPQARERANLRVAVANGLYDKAVRSLRRG
ncbi:MAG TPA: hypothetical protein VEH77_08585 [Roseiarcus sp.]|nr:hypothetical protein [Roseiarcus sp.]